MLTEAELDRVCVVLVRARNPSNIGAVARAMHDFGFSRLRVVNEFHAPFEGARSAVDASEVMARAVTCASVAEAVADCTLVVGTTAVGERHLLHKLLQLAEAAPIVRRELQRDATESDTGRVALVFGSEKTGLSNEELSHCNWLLTIPMQEHAGVRHASMNLGQAVAVCLYEVARSEAASATDSPELAPAGDLERLAALLTELLERTEYPRRHPGQSDAATVRRLVLRMSLSAGDAVIWMGILRQMVWKLDARKE